MKSWNWRVMYNPFVKKYKVQLKKHWWSFWKDLGTREIGFTDASMSPYSYIEPFLFDTEEEAIRAAAAHEGHTTVAKNRWHKVPATGDYPGP